MRAVLDQHAFRGEFVADAVGRGEVLAFARRSALLELLLDPRRIDVGIAALEPGLRVLLQTTLTYMLAALVLPDFFGEQTIDLRAHYFAHRTLFFGLFVLVLLTSIGKEWMLYRKWPDRVDLGFQLGFLAFCLAGALVVREWYHKVFCLIGAGAFVAYIAVLFVHLR